MHPSDANYISVPSLEAYRNHHFPCCDSQHRRMPSICNGVSGLEGTFLEWPRTIPCDPMQRHSHGLRTLWYPATRHLVRPRGFPYSGRMGASMPPSMGNPKTFQPRWGRACTHMPPFLYTTDVLSNPSDQSLGHPSVCPCPASLPKKASPPRHWSGCGLNFPVP